MKIEQKAVNHIYPALSVHPEHTKREHNLTRGSWLQRIRQNIQMTMNSKRVRQRKRHLRRNLAGLEVDLQEAEEKHWQM